MQPGPLAATVNELLDAGKRVFISDDNPTFGFGPFMCKYRQGLLLGKRCDMDSADFEARHASYTAQLQEVVEAAPGSALLEVATYFCDESTCSMRVGDEVLFRDLNHLNLLGSDYLAQNVLRDDARLAEGLGRIAPAP